MPWIINCSQNTTGNLIPISSDTTVATVAVDSANKNRILVTPVKAGTCTVTINISDDSIHSEADPKECTIRVISKASATPDLIQNLIKTNQHTNLLAVGDKFSFPLSGSVTGTSVTGSWYACILGLNHNPNVEGDKTIHLHFPYSSSGTPLTFVDGYYSAQGSSAGFRINLSNTSSGGWKSSYMKNTVMVQMYDTMTAEWQSVIKDATKYNDNTGGSGGSSSYVTASTSKVWLLAEWEVFGSRSKANASEQSYQQRYKYFQNGASGIKYRHNSTSTSAEWWLSSLYPGSSSYPWLTITAGGSEDYWHADRSYGLAPLVVIA